MSQDTQAPDERAAARQRKKDAERRAAAAARIAAEAERTAALLKDVTAEMVAVIEQLDNDLQANRRGYNGGLVHPDHNTFWLRRRAILGGIMERLVRKASGLADNGSLDGLRHIELVLRLRDAELAMATATEHAERRAKDNPKLYGWATKNAGYEWPAPAAGG